MLTRWIKRPFWPFLISALLSTALGLIYYFFYPGSYLDISTGNYHNIHTGMAWLIIALYLFILSAVYYAEDRRKYLISGWLIILHFVFILFFLIFFFVFSSFNSSYAKHLLNGVPFFTLIGIYGGIFLLDLSLFLLGIVSLLINLFSFHKERR
jgi:hypothetical protein